MCIPTTSIVNYHSMSMWSRYIGICNCSLPQWINLTCRNICSATSIVTTIYFMCMIACIICTTIVVMTWKFPDSILRRSLPQVNTNIRLHVVMGFVITSIAYSNIMNMGTCCIGRIGICAITITTTGNTSVRFVRTTKGKCVWMISCRVCACSMCMSRKFSDRGVRRYVSRDIQLNKVVGYYGQYCYQFQQ